MGDEAGRCNLLIELQHQFVQTVGRVADNSQMEYEAKSLGWYMYDVSTFLLHKSLEMEFGLEEDEWVNMRNNVRQRKRADSFTLMPMNKTRKDGCIM
ncbi:hypothetical protein L1987_29885 [Smallanthus sonchifolius]|uniref:Uncharacterized protein n=1 Tax=Smallanthus sonchifolius TaxID=185202 RepID=A0ACB9I1Z7_9ASTR|nr:hypothetical protein L1987_29885 [Smallanthus sonchifolius]